ncbi:MAG TPA: thioredoxin family protein, partial [Burkholderiales bacterium]|nr:thioredoxin family protein [Burkholderiales bacterium]
SFSSLFLVTPSRHVFLALLLAVTSLYASVATAAQFFALNTGDLKAELADARADKRVGILVFFEQEGCPGCRHMKEHILNRRDVQDYYGKNFVSLAIDINGSVPLKDFTGRDSTEKGYAQISKVRGTPTFIFHDLTGNEIVRIFGPLQTPEEFLLLGQFVASGAYKTRTFAQYKLEKPISKGT